MRFRQPVFLRLLAGVLLACLLVACDQTPQSSTHVVRVGILSSSSGFSERWGMATRECADATAGYWNEKGGFEIGSRRYRIELIHADYDSDAQTAMRKVSELIHEHDVRYMVGPLSDDVAVAVAPLMDAAGVAYVHYGFTTELVREDSLGILGMPIPVQTLPVIFEYLSQSKGVESVCVLATDDAQAMGQKLLAERAAGTYGIQPLRYSTFDVAEENFDASLPGDQLMRRFEGLQRAQPGAVLLCGMGPNEVPQALFYIREVGFEGPVVALNTQEPALFRDMQELADDFIFVGGHMSEGVRSDYYEALRTRVIDEIGEWQLEADVKLYALDALLRLIRLGGPDAVHDPGVLFSVLENPNPEPDPFFDSSRTLRFIGKDVFSTNRQISVPILLSEISDGTVETVYQSELAN